MHIHLPYWSPAAALLMALATPGCASRRLPEGYPKGSPASLEAQPGEQADVTRALREEPPAPGADARGWSGLGGASQPAADPHAHHRHARGAEQTKDAGHEHDGGQQRPTQPEHSHHHGAH